MARARLERAIGKPETWKSFEIRLLEIEPASRCEVETGDGRIPSVGVRARILYRQFHVSTPQLGDDRAVGQLHHRVHDRLRMNDDVDAVARQVEQPMRLD